MMICMLHFRLRSVSIVPALAIAAAFVVVARADEGMWTFDHPPVESIKKEYGFDVVIPWMARQGR